MPAVPRTILITGASAGIGEALAQVLAGQGHRLALTARRADRLDEVAGALRSLGSEVLTVPADLADPETPARLLSETVSRFGGLDVLVNNAGYGLPRFFSDSDPEDVRRQIEVNLTAPLILTRLALPYLLERRGMVINVGSSITSVANPVFGAYGTTKAALAYWNDALRRELKHRGVRVCLVEPGPVETGFFDAVQSLAGNASALGIGPPTDRVYNALRDRPPHLLSADPGDAARRIARLLDHPRRRLSFLRRTVWPLRILGGLIQIAPGFGDWAISGMTQRIEREQAKRDAARQAALEGADVPQGR
jgi:short-subunit dehydrogenase